MDDATLTELRTLQRRAYGPDADIGGDAAALARLRELEATARPVASASGGPQPPAEPGPGESPAPPGAPAPPSAPPAPPTTPAAPLPPVAVPSVVAPDARRGRRAARLRRRQLVAWVLSLVAVAAITAVLTAVISGTGPAVAGGAREVATLTDPIDNTQEWLSQWMAGDTETMDVYSFLGLTVITAEAPGLDIEQPCIVVLSGLPDSTDGGGNWGASTSGCGVGAFPAAAQFIVGEEFPQELRDRFPTGTALQFVWGGAEVRVYAAAGTATA